MGNGATRHDSRSCLRDPEISLSTSDVNLYCEQHKLTPIGVHAPEPALTRKQTFKLKFESLLTQLKTQNVKAQLEQLVKEYTPDGIFEEKYIRYDGIFEEYLFYILLQLGITASLTDFIDSQYYNPKNNLVNNSQSTYLMNAIHHNNKPLANKIIQKGGTWPTQVNSSNDTELIFACYHGWEDIALQLLEEKECRHDVINNVGKSALYYSLQKGLLTIAKKLVRLQMADPKIFKEIYQFYYTKTKTHEHNYLFYVLSKLGATDVLQEYVESKYFDPEQQPLSTDANCHTYLLEILNTSNNTKDLATALVLRGNYKPAHVDSDDDTALIYACYRNYSEIALKILEEKDCRPAQCNRHGIDALAYALKNNMKEVIPVLVNRLLKENGDKKNLMNEKYTLNFTEENRYRHSTFNPLFYRLIDTEQFQIISDYLDSKECNINAINQSYTDTPITALIKSKQFELAKKALTRCFTTTSNVAGDDALILACNFNSTDLAEFLLKHNYPFDRINNLKQSALSLAIANNMKSVAYNIIDAVKNAFESLKMDEKVYQAITTQTLEIACKMNVPAIVEILLSKFIFDHTYILSLYRKNSKEIRTVIMQHFDLGDQGFLIEKYGIDKLHLIMSDKK